MTRRFKLLFVMLLPLGLAACGAESDDACTDCADAGDAAPADSGSGTDATTDAATDAADDTTVEDVGEELDFTPDPSCTEGSWVVRVGGQVVDEAGAPLEGAKAQVCLRRAASEVALCLRPTDVDSAGNFSVVLPESERCVERLSLRVIKTGSTLATTYCHVETAGAEADLVVAEPFTVFDTPEPVSRPPAGDSGAARDVDFGGLVVSVVPDELRNGASANGVEIYDELRAVVLDPSTVSSCMFDSLAGLRGVAGFDPEADVVDVSWNVTVVDPVGGLTPGATVEFFVLGGLEPKTDAGELIPEAEWVSGGTGTVGDDGATITAAGVMSGVNWLGWRLAE